LRKLSCRSNLRPIVHQHHFVDIPAEQFVQDLIDHIDEVVDAEQQDFEEKYEDLRREVLHQKPT
jgi:hypothetical protein